jgi:glycosyl hydrolase family 114
VTARLAALLLAAAALSGCATPTASAEVRFPPVSGSFDYQLGGAYDTVGLAVVARDATATPLAGTYNVCYVNGFQTQPGDGERWLRDHGSALLRDAGGEPVTDPDWPDEYVLDPSTAAQRATILDVLGPVVSGCADKGFDAVEVDNFDTFTRFSDVDRAGAIELARSFARIAHDRGLAIGQKNAAESTETGRREIGFDFAVAEECATYRECDRYRKAYGDHVLQIEYTDDLPVPFGDVCSSPDRAPLTILRDRDLAPKGTDGHVYEQC